jgi:hypothetical protein
MPPKATKATKKKNINENYPPQKGATQKGAPHKGRDFGAEQDEELRLLAVLHHDDFSRVEVKTAWGKAPTEKGFTLRLHSEGNEISIVLNGRLPATYPNVKPLLTIENPIGTKTKTLARMKRILIEIPAKSTLENTRIFEIANEIKALIDEDATSLAQGEAMPSLEEQRTEIEQEANEKAAEALALRTKQDEEEVVKRLNDEVAGQLSKQKSRRKWKEERREVHQGKILRGFNELS